MDLTGKRRRGCPEWLEIFAGVAFENSPETYGCHVRVKAGKREFVRVAWMQPHIQIPSG